MAEDNAAAHPVWSSDNEAIKEEFRRLERRLDKWQRWHRRADAEAERFQEVLERLQAGPDTLTPDGLRIVNAALHPTQPVSGANHGD